MTNKTKQYLTSKFQIKSIDKNGIFEGYGSIFHIEDAHKDIVVPGAFEKSLAAWKQKGSLPPVLWQHNSAKPLGPYLEIKEDEKGLFVRGQLLVDDITQAKEAHALMKSGAVTGLSIGYNVVVDEYDRETGISILKEVDLWEISIVTFPANDIARIENVKSIETKRDFEKFLRESGFSKSEAVRIASRGYERRDSADAELEQVIKESISILRG